MKKFFLYLIIYIVPFVASNAQTEYPTFDPQATFTTITGEEIEDASSGVSAPLVAHLTANPSNVDGYTVRYEWKIYRSGEKDSPIVHRFEEDVDYTFTESGTFYIQLYATYFLGDEAITYPEEGEENPIQVTISESQLDFPNAFSPNGDQFNETFKAKEGYQSIVEFHATVFNRWGQKIYSWDDPAGEWDGKWHGHRVKDGVYFLVVKARGADGRKYNIRKDINVLTGLNKDNESGD